MSKSLWSRSVWNSLFNRAGSRRLARKARRNNRPKLDAPAESLEQRMLLTTVDVTFGGGILTLAANEATNQTVKVQVGSAYTDIYVNNKFQTRVNGASQNTVTQIDYTGDTGTDTLNVIGVTQDLTVNLSDVERLLLNTRNTTVDADEALRLGASTVAGDLNLTVAGAVTQNGKLSVSGVTAIDTTAVAGSNVTLATSGNTFGDLIINAGSGAITINEAGPTTLGDSDGVLDFIGASLKVTSTGAITDVGVLDINGAVTLTSNGNSITLDNVASDFDGVLTLKGTNVTIVNNNTTATDLGKVTATGTFSLTTSGAVTHTSGTISVGGLATIDTTFAGADAADAITITAGTNNFGSLSLTGTAVQITEKSATVLAATTASSLVVTSKGSITDSDQVTVSGITTLTANGAAINLDESSSTYTGTLTMSGTNISVINDTATALGTTTAKGTLSITSNGGVSSASLISVTGLATIVADDGSADYADVSLTNVANAFGSISVTGEDVTLFEGGATNLAGLTVAGTTTGLAVTSTGTVTDSGALDVAGATSISAAGQIITLDHADNAFTGAMTLTGSNITINNTVNTSLDDVTATGTFSLTSSGTVTDDPVTTGNIDVTGQATITSLEAITLNTSTNLFSSVSLSGDGVTIVDNGGGLDLVAVTSTSNLSVITTGGALTDSGTVTVFGTTTLQAGSGNNITLDTSNSTFGSTVTVTSGANVSITDSDALGFTLGASTISGTLTLIAPDSDITASASTTIDATAVTTTSVTLNAGTTGSISITGITFADADVNLTLTGVNATFTPVGATVPNVALGTSSLSGTLSLTNVNTVTQSGAVTVAGATNISTAVPASDAITLTAVGNSFGTLTVSANTVTIYEAAATDLGASTVTGALTIVSSGDVTDSGNLSVTGAATVTSNGGNDITLNSSGNAFGSLVLHGNDVAIVETNATTLGTTVATGTFSLTSGGAVTQSGAATVLNVAGAASVTSTGAGASGNITLTSTANNFGSIATSGTTVSITEQSATVLGTTSATTALTVDSAGDISGTGVVTAGTTSLTAGVLDNAAITLDNASNSFGALTLNGGNVTIVDNDAGTVLAATNISGDLTLTSTGPVNDNSDLTVAGLATIVAYNSTTATNQNIELNNNGNYGSLSLTGANVTVVESSDTVFEDTTVSGNLSVTSTGHVTDNGVLTVSGTTSITTATDKDIILNSPDSTFLGSITTSGNDIEIQSNSAVDLGTTEATGDLTVIANGAITDSGTLTYNDAYIDAGTNSLILNLGRTFNGTSETFIGSPAIVVTDTTGPTATASVPDVSSPTNADSLTFTVTFDEPVINVGTTDFTLTKTGTADGTISGVSGSGATRTVTVSGIVGDGTLKLNVITTGVNDVVGNVGVGTFTGVTAVTIDNTPTAAPTITSVTDNVGTITGALTSGGTTDDTTLVVRVTFSLTAPVAVAGDTVQLYNGVSALGSAVTLSPTNITNGYVDITTPTLTNGTTYSLNAKVIDQATNSSAASATFTTTIDTSAPSAPSAPDLDSASDSGASNSDNITNDNTPTFTGTAEAGSTVTIYDGVTAVGSGTATGGNYSITVSALGDGAHTITAKATDAAGNTSIASGSLSVTIDTANPTPVVSTSSTLSAAAIAALTPPATIDVTFSIDFGQTVVGFAFGDITIGGTGVTYVAPIAGDLTGGTNGLYTFTIHVNGGIANDTLSVSVGTTVATDVAGNDNNASNTATITVGS